MKREIKCTICKKEPIIQLKNPAFLEEDTTECCPDCHTELAYVIEDDANNNSWFIRTSTASIINNK
tara:strand:+ start:635 stop:832 length:198 start_codon:yes stop_codon:yes gene_type:complete